MTHCNWLLRVVVHCVSTGCSILGHSAGFNEQCLRKRDFYIALIVNEIIDI